MAERHVSGARLSAFLDDELPEGDALAATRHLAWCPRCLTELEALRATRDALRSLPHLQAPVLTSGVERRSGSRRRIVRPLGVMALGGVIPAVLFAVAYLMGGELGEVEPSTELFLVEHVTRTGGGPVPAPVGASER